MLKRVIQAVVAVFAASAVLAMDVSYDERTPEEHRKWADSCYLREQMEVLGVKICEALYGNGPRSRLHETARIVLHLEPRKGGAPAFAAGRRITWKVGANPGGDASSGMGLLCHEMTHVLDMGSDGVFTEAMADWVRNYKVHYRRCSSPSQILDRRYAALRGARRYGKYMAGANFVDFMMQNYGEGTIFRILEGYREHRGKVWEKLYGKTLDGLVEEWRNMQTIYDPVFQWTYNASEKGIVRHDGKYCPRKEIGASVSRENSGAWLDGASSCALKSHESGDMTLTFHGRFPKASKVAIASAGSLETPGGKALLLATGSKTDVLAAHLFASIPGRGRTLLSTVSMDVPGLSSKPHNIVLAVKDGAVGAVVVDGKAMARIDMKAKFPDGTFSAAFGVGGIHGADGISGFSEPRGPGGVLLDDLRVFVRTFRSRETALYASTFGEAYRGDVAVEAVWAGPQGGADIREPANWNCYSSIGEKIAVLPTRETAVTVTGKALPSIPAGTKFPCKSFTVDGWAVADEASIDLRGVRIVDVSDNARIITRSGHGIAVSALRAKRLRLDGMLAVSAGLKATDNLEMKEGSVLRLPENPEMAFVKSLSVKGEGTVTLRPGKVSKNGGFQRIMRMEEMPEDLSRFRLSPSGSAKDARFKVATGGKFLGVST